MTGDRGFLDALLVDKSGHFKHCIKYQILNIKATSGNISHHICSLLLVVSIDSLALIHRAIIFPVYLNSKGKVIAKPWIIIHVS